MSCSNRACGAYAMSPWRRRFFRQMFNNRERVFTKMEALGCCRPTSRRQHQLSQTPVRMDDAIGGSRSRKQPWQTRASWCLGHNRQGIKMQSLRSGYQKALFTGQLRAEFPLEYFVFCKYFITFKWCLRKKCGCVIGHWIWLHPTSLETGSYLSGR